MKRIALILVAVLTAGCASQEQARTNDIEQAVRDYIEVTDLQEVKFIRSDSRDRWEKIDQNFIIYRNRSEAFLVEFVRRCWELDEVRVIPDARNSSGRIEARSETIRGCRIQRIFALTEDQAAELKDIGESPGSRN